MAHRKYHPEKISAVQRALDRVDISYRHFSSLSLDYFSTTITKTLISYCLLGESFYWRQIRGRLIVKYDDRILSGDKWRFNLPSLEKPCRLVLGNDDFI